MAEYLRHLLSSSVLVVIMLSCTLVVYLVYALVTGCQARSRAGRSRQHARRVTLRKPEEAAQQEQRHHHACYATQQQHSVHKRLFYNMCLERCRKLPRDSPTLEMPAYLISFRP